MKKVKLYPLQKPVTKIIEIPGSKSYTNRALLMAALTKNPVIINNPLFSDDTWAMIGCLRLLGVAVELDENEIIIKGSIDDIKDCHYVLNTNLAATAIRFLLPLLTIVPGEKILKGKEGLNKRPIDELVKALRQLGAKIEYLEKEGYPPLKISSSELQPKPITMNGNVSSQFFSALFMIAPLIDGLIINVEGEQTSKPYIDMTIDSMKQFGINVENNSYGRYHIPTGQTYRCETYTVEGDFSSAGYFFAIAALTQSTFILKNLNPQSHQADKKLLEVLETMGNKITYGENEIVIVGKTIKPVTINMKDFPDQAQTLSVLVSFANEESVINGLETLHVKETDRLKAISEELNRMNIKTQTTNDTITIRGGSPTPVDINTYGDHRMAMAFAVAGAKISDMKINDPDVVNKTFPDFWDIMEKIGIKIEKENK